MAIAEIRPDWTIGTLNLTSGSTSFTTTDSLLETAAIQAGDEIITASGLVLVIATITGQNAGILMEPCPAGAAGDGQPLRIRFQPDGSRYNGATADLVQLLGSGNVYAFAGLDGVSDGVPVFTGAGTMELINKSEFGPEDTHSNLAQLAALAKQNNQFIVMGDDGAIALRPFSDTVVSSFSPSRPMMIAHRNQAQLYPDQSLGSFRESSLSPVVDALEIDCRVLIDGGVVAFHDATVDRVTTSTGNVESLTTAQFKALIIDGEVWQGSNTKDGAVTVTVDEVLKEFKGTKLFMPEIKSAGKGQQVVDVFVANNIPTDQAVFSSFRLSDLSPAKAAGYQTMFATSTGTPTEIADAIDAGVEWVALNKDASNQVVLDWIAAGIKVVSWSVNRRYDRDRLLALGVTGFYSDDVEYIARDKSYLTSMDLSGGNWLPGMLAASDRLTQNWRGRIFPDGSWGWPVKQADTNSTRQFVLQGWASKLPLGDVSVTTRLRFIDSDTNARWCAIAMTDTDREMLDDPASDTWTSGYSALVNQNGNLSIYKVVNGVATNITTTAVPVIDRVEIPNGGECIVRLDFSGATITLSRLSPNGSVMYSASASDSTYRGGYLQFGRRHVAASFKDVKIESTVTHLPMFPVGADASGSNANGNFVRYADGTQICWTQVTVTTTSTAPIGGTVEWVYPASFVGVAHAFSSIGVNSGQADGRAAANYSSSIRAETSSVAYLDWFFNNQLGGSTPVTMRMNGLAIGRWF